MEGAGGCLVRGAAAGSSVNRAGVRVARLERRASFSGLAVASRFRGELRGEVRLSGEAGGGVDGLPLADVPEDFGGVLVPFDAELLDSGVV